MKHKDGKKSIGSNVINDPSDQRVACFNWKNYSFRHCRSKAIAWLVQFAIRSDLAQAAVHLKRGNDFRCVMDGYTEIQAKIPQLLALICDKHVIDERDLATIGLSLYNFPTLSYFFEVPRTQSFVREANLSELRAVLESMHATVATSKLANLISDCDDQGETPISHPVFDQMTYTALQREAGVPEDRVAKDRLFVVDLTAPVEILKKQFRDCLERFPKQKNNSGSDYSDWEDYGLLPYIDLQHWGRMCFRGSITQNVQQHLIYKESSYHGIKTLDTTTLSNVNRMLDTSSPAFCALQRDAAIEFQNAVQFALHPDDFSDSEGPNEALTRWFPCTFPHNLPRLKRMCLRLPVDSSPFPGILDEIESSGELGMGLAERIRLNRADESDAKHISRIWQEIAALEDEPQP